MRVDGPEDVDYGTETCDSQVGIGPCAEDSDAGTKTGDVQVGRGPQVDKVEGEGDLVEVGA